MKYRMFNIFDQEFDVNLKKICSEGNDMDSRAIFNFIAIFQMTFKSLGVWD